MPNRTELPAATGTASRAKTAHGTSLENTLQIPVRLAFNKCKLKENDFKSVMTHKEHAAEQYSVQKTKTKGARPNWGLKHRTAGVPARSIVQCTVRLVLVGVAFGKYNRHLNGPPRQLHLLARDFQELLYDNIACVNFLL